jgi:DUF971 family protein
MDTTATLSRPVDIVLHGASARLAIEWSDGSRQALPFALLREACKCSACEHARREGRPVKAADGIALTGIEPYGEALHLTFSDGHDRGIYPFAYLHELKTQP